MPFGQMENQKHNLIIPKSGGLVGCLVGWLVGIATALKVENLTKRYRSFGTYIIRQCAWRRGFYSLSHLRRRLVRLLRSGVP